MLILLSILASPIVPATSVIISVGCVASSTDAEDICGLLAGSVSSGVDVTVAVAGTVAVVAGVEAVEGTSEGIEGAVLVASLFVESF